MREKKEVEEEDFGETMGNNAENYEEDEETSDVRRRLSEDENSELLR